MLINLHELISRAAVVRGDSLIGYIDHIEINDSGVYIILEDGSETPQNEENNIVDLDKVEIDEDGRLKIVRAS